MNLYPKIIGHLISPLSKQLPNLDVLMTGIIRYIYHPQSEGMGKVLFSQVCVCSQGKGVPHLHPPILPSTGLMSFPGGTPVSGPMSLPRGLPLSSPRQVTPAPRKTEQQSEYLLRGRWYASCFYTAGLSCNTL